MDTGSFIITTAEREATTLLSGFTTRAATENENDVLCDIQS